MNRRRFLSLFGMGVAGVALDQAIPLGRVWSFPKTIVVPKPIEQYSDYVSISDMAYTTAIHPYTAFELAMLNYHVAIDERLTNGTI